MNTNGYKSRNYSKINAAKYAKDTRSFAIDKFLGVDFTIGEYITDNRRSPDAVNTIWGDNPYSFSNRRGKKKLATYDSSLTLNGIHYIDSTGEVLLHIGATLLKYTLNASGEFTGIGGDISNGRMNNAKSMSFYFEGILYILDGKNYWMYNGVTFESVSLNAYIPTTIKNGATYEKVNLLTRKRINQFCPKAIETIYTGYKTTNQSSSSTYTLKYETSDGTFASLPKERFKEIDHILVNETEYITEYTLTNDGTNKQVTFDASSYDVGTKFEIQLIIWDNTFSLDTTSATDVVVKAYEKVNNVWTWVTLTRGTHYSVTQDGESKVKVVMYDSKTQTCLDGNEGIDTLMVTFNNNENATKTQYSYTKYDVGGSTIRFEVSNNIYIVSKSDCKLYVKDLAASEEEEIPISDIEMPSRGFIDITRSSIAHVYQARLVCDALTFDFPIDKCTICGIYGGENDMRVFFSGNPDSPNKDWYCGLYDPTYIPDTGYTYVGTKESAIMGYIKQYDTQIVIKENSQDDTSAWLRTYTIDSNGDPMFPIEQGSVGTGAISSRTFAYLNTNPLFLSSQGVMKLAGTNVDYQRLIQCVSEKINSKLLLESNLKDAIGVEHDDKYYLFVNNHVYVADARMMYEDNFGIAQYEWMYWDNIQATAVKKCGKYLLFGSNGMIYRFKIKNETNEFQDEDYLSSSSTNLFIDVVSQHVIEQKITNRDDGIYKYVGENIATSSIYSCKLDKDNYYKITTYSNADISTTSAIDNLLEEEKTAIFTWKGTNETIYESVTLYTNHHYNTYHNGAEWTIIEFSVGANDQWIYFSPVSKGINLLKVTNTYQEHEIYAYWTTPKFTLSSISYKKKFKNLFILFNKATSVRCKISGTIDSDYNVDFGTIERLNMSEYDTAVYKENINIESLDNISLKFEKVVGSATQNASFGIEMFQILYQFKDNY